MLGQCTLIDLHCLHPLWLLTIYAWKAHGYASVEGAKPYTVNLISNFGEDCIEILNSKERLDLDDNGSLLVDVLMESKGRVEGCVGDSWEKAGRGCGACAVDGGAVFSDRDDVFGLFDGFDLWDDDRCACIECETYVGVVVAWDTVCRQM
jgi:hypothetical protein